MWRSASCVYINKTDESFDQYWWPTQERSTTKRSKQRSINNKKSMVLAVAVDVLTQPTTLFFTTLAKWSGHVGCRSGSGTGAVTLASLGIDAEHSLSWPSISISTHEHLPVVNILALGPAWCPSMRDSQRTARRQPSVIWPN